MPYRLFTEDGLTVGTITVSAMTWLTTRTGIVAQSTTVEWSGMVVATIGLAALVVRTYGEAGKVRAAERLRVLDHQHAERMRHLEHNELQNKLARYEARAEYERRMCASGVCPFPNPDGSARCDGADLPLSLEQAPVVLAPPIKPDDTGEFPTITTTEG
jgi:hypothetical protein